MHYVDERSWRQAAAHPDWYLRIQADYKALIQRAVAQPNEAEAIKEAVRSCVEDLLINKKLMLGQPNPELDAPRQPIRQIIIHHSKRKPGYYTLQRLNAVHLLNLYVPYYTSPRLPAEKHLRGQPISSNHYQDGEMVFYGYHWWVEADGNTTRLLPDNAIGWHAGNWEINCSSLAICINDDLTNQAPTEAALQSVRAIINKYYDHLGPLQVLGHQEVNPRTACPGSQFLGADGWQQALTPTR